MKRRSACSLVLIALFAFTLLAASPACSALGHKDPDRYSRKIHKKLAHIKPGVLLEVRFKDDTTTVGKLKTLDENGTFSFSSSETNTVRVFSYTDVRSIRKGQNSVQEEHIKRHHWYSR